MIGSNEDHDPGLGRVLDLTVSGRKALQEPQLGLTITQRWLLARIGDGASLAEIGASGGGTAQIARLPRDAAKLVGLGLAVDVGEAGPVVFAVTTRSGELSESPSLSNLDDMPSPPSPRDAGVAPAARPRRIALVVLAVGLAGAGAVYWAVHAARPSTAASPGAPLAEAPSKARSATTSAVVVGEPAQSVAASARADQSGAASVVDATAEIDKPAPPSDGLPRVIAAAEIAPPDRRATAPKAPAAQKPAAAPVVAAALPLPAVRLQPSKAPVTGAALSERLAAGPAPVALPPTAAAAVPVVATPVSAAPEVVATAPLSSEVGVARSAAAAPLAPLSRTVPAFPRDVDGDARREVSLQAQLTIGADGDVTRVDFPGSSLRTRPYERVARNALLQWRFPAGAPDRGFRAELNFKPE